MDAWLGGFAEAIQASPFGVWAGESAYAYPDQTRDPSLGMPHQFLQIQDHTKTPVLIAPAPYETAQFVLPPWIKA